MHIRATPVPARQPDTTSPPVSEIKPLSNSLFSRKRWRKPPEKPPYSTTKQTTSASTLDFPSKTSTSTCSPEKPQTLPASVPSRSHPAETRNDKETEKDDDQDVTRMTVTTAVPLHQAQSSFQKLKPRKHSTNKSKNSQAFLFFDCFELDKCTANDFSTLVINSTGRKRPVRIPDAVRRDKKAPLSFLDEEQSKTKSVFFDYIDLNNIEFSVTERIQTVTDIDLNHIDFSVTKGIKTNSTDNFLHKVDSIYTSDVLATGGTKSSTTNNVYGDNRYVYGDSTSNSSGSPLSEMNLTSSINMIPKEPVFMKENNSSSGDQNISL